MKLGLQEKLYLGNLAAKRDRGFVATGQAHPSKSSSKTASKSPRVKRLRQSTGTTRH
jgi:hypothetical protein